MSNDIQTGNMPLGIHNHKGAKAPEQGPTGQQITDSPAKSSDTVSITDEVSRLQKLEAQLNSIPPVNDELVTEMVNAIANGTLDIDLDRAASKLIEIETGVLDSDK